MHRERQTETVRHRQHVALRKSLKQGVTTTPCPTVPYGSAKDSASLHSWLPVLMENQSLDREQHTFH